MIHRGQSLLSVQFAVGALFSALVLSTPGALGSNDWTGNGDWTNGTQWSLGHVPLAGEDVVISGGTVTQAVSSANALASYTLNAGATHVLDGWSIKLTAVNVTIQGTMTHTPNTDTNGSPGVPGDWSPNSRVYLECTNLFVATSGSISVTGKGYRGGDGDFFGPLTNGAGPGGGRCVAPGGGGGYGGTGAGAALVGTTNYGATYGSASAPTDPGSGGGGRAGCCANFSRLGGAGGGVVQIDATDMVTINGSVIANGGDPIDDRVDAGGGSGGSVYITCRTLAGTNGAISANGGLGFYTGGAGGRIAVIYNPTAQSNQNATARPTILFSANQGAGSRPGTLYFPDTSVGLSSLIGGGELIIPGVSTYVFDSVTITNGLAVFPVGSTVLVSNELATGGTRGGIEVREGFLRVNGNFTVGGSSLGNSYFYCLPSTGFVVTGNVTVRDAGVLSYYATNLNYSVLSVGSNLTVTNVGKVYLYAAPTNAASPGYSIKVDVGKELVVATNAWIYPISHGVNGGSVYFHVKDLTLAAPNGGFDALGRGYKGGNDQIVAGGPERGYGPGGGFAGAGLANGSGGGGGYGGFGWYYQIVNGTNCGWTYGTSNAPAEPGSGGGGRNGTADNRMGGWGGGLVWIDAERLATLNGDINAAGGPPNSDGFQGGASGGAIYLRVRRLEGATGRLYVNGSSSQAAGGGGGRIAILSTYNNATTQTWTIVSSGGTGNGQNGLAGTVYFGRIAFPGTVFVVH